ncbi:MAG: hypothetical protein J0H57_04060, partial [Rhodospirillales bacterium]|nr:hypothetical protein [Rhodospirillales bacterium]
MADTTRNGRLPLGEATHDHTGDARAERGPGEHAHAGHGHAGDANAGDGHDHGGHDHAGHDDVMSVADVGWGMLFARNAQEAGDFCLICRKVAEATQTPFFNVQDGFLTTHTVETVRLTEPEFMKEFVGDPKARLTNLMDTANPMMSGVVQNQDSYMKGKIAQRWYYDQVPDKLQEAFDEFARKTGRRYGTVEAHRCEDAEYVLVGMGCYMETAKATVDYLRDVKNVKAGCLT